MEFEIVMDTTVEEAGYPKEAGLAVPGHRGTMRLDLITAIRDVRP